MFEGISSICIVLIEKLALKTRFFAFLIDLDLYSKAFITDIKANLFFCEMTEFNMGYTTITGARTDTCILIMAIPFAKGSDTFLINPS